LSYGRAALLRLSRKREEDALRELSRS